MKYDIQVLSKERFDSYGTIIEHSVNGEEDFEIVVNEVEGGWRIAVLRFSNRELSMMEYHPKSKETFEPLSGIALIAVAAPEDPEAIEVFLLDQPICIKAGVWHNVVALSEECMVKIVENSHVEAVRHQLEISYKPALERL